MMADTSPSPGGLLKRLTGFLRTFKAFVSGLAVMACAIAPASAQPGPSPGAVIASFISDPFFGSFFRELSEHNPDVAAMHARWQEATARAGVADALPDPQLSVGLYLQEVETRVGPQQARLGISQALPWKGKRKLKADMASADAEALHNQYENLRVHLFSRFKQWTYELLYLNQAIGVTRQHVDLLTEWEALMEARYTTDSAGLSDWIRVQVEMDRLKDRLASLQAARGPVAAELNRMLNRPVMSEFELPQGFDVTVPEQVDVSTETLVPSTLRFNFELQALDNVVDRKKQNIALSKKDFFPDFTVGMDFIQTGSSPVPGVEGSGKDPVILKFGMSIPLNRKKYRQLETAASRGYIAATKNRVSRQNELTARLALVAFQYEDAVRKLQLYRDKLIPDTRDSLDVTVRAYEAGGDGFLDIIDTERTLLALELGLKRANADGLKALADLEEITARPMIRAADPGQDGQSGASETGHSEQE